MQLLALAMVTLAAAGVPSASGKAAPKTPSGLHTLWSEFPLTTRPAGDGYTRQAGTTTPASGSKKEHLADGGSTSRTVTTPTPGGSNKAHSAGGGHASQPAAIATPSRIKKEHEARSGPASQAVTTTAGSRSKHEHAAGATLAHAQSDGATSTLGVIVAALAGLLGVACVVRLACTGLALSPLGKRPLVRRLLRHHIPVGLVGAWVVLAGLSLWVVSRL
jgi:hypothetical protein